MIYEQRLTFFEAFTRPTMILVSTALVYSWVNLVNQYFATTFEIVIVAILLVGIFTSPITAIIGALFVGLAFDSTASELHLFCTGYYLFVAGLTFYFKRQTFMIYPAVAAVMVLLLVLGKIVVLEILYYPFIMQNIRINHAWTMFNWQGFVFVLILTSLIWIPLGRLLNPRVGDRHA